MKRTFIARVWKEDEWYIARCLEVGVTSQGESEPEALGMLKEALELYFSPPEPGTLPRLHQIEVDVDAAIQVDAV